MHPTTAGPDRPVPKRGTFLAWIGLLFVGLFAAALVGAASVLRGHADQRLAVMERLGAIETIATAQSGIVWHALTLQMSEQVHAFTRLRGDEQRGRGRMYEQLDELRKLDEEGAELNALLGFETQSELLDNLDAVAGSFLGGVQGVFGQMNLSHDRVRQRLDHWDMNFGYFQEVLHEVQAKNSEIATAASRAAARVSGTAALVVLIAAALFVLRLGQIRARRELDLAAERVATLAQDEARFRELLQHSSDLIFVLEPGGEVRFATPSAEALAQPLEDPQAGAPPTVRSAEALLGRSVRELLAEPSNEIGLVDREGETRVFDIHARNLCDHPDIRGIVLNARDITERKQLEQRLRHQALHDPLTDLPNRRAFQERFDALDAEARARAAVLFVDLDGFKLVNDSYGHTAGDRLLVSTASRLASCLGNGAVLARQGGDEFLVLVQGDAERTAERILEALRPPFPLEGTPVFISASIGIADDLAECDSSDAAQRADIAMYAAKQAGKAQAIVFTEGMLEGAPERIKLESDFREALEKREFQVYYQPKVGFTSGRIESLEALVRWIHPERGFVGPDLFIPFAEESGLICELGAQVLEQACEDALRWQGRGVVVAVNLSPMQFQNPDLVAEIDATLKRTGVDPKLIELEITESAVLGDLESTVRMFNELKALGVRLAIDDFGTGYSNLSHLKHFDVDVLKIDQAFVRGGNPSNVEHLSDRTIVQAVIGMAKAFDMHVVAEGVESANHVSELRDLGADLGQGFFFSRPITGEGIDELLASEDVARDASERRAA